MKIKLHSIILSFIFLVAMLTGCDPIMPSGDLSVKDIEAISVGDTVDIEIIYPDTEGTAANGWENQKIEIISGDDVISVSGLTVTALEKGTATIKVSATTDLYEEGRNQFEDRVYSTEVEITVE